VHCYCGHYWPIVLALDDDDDDDYDECGAIGGMNGRGNRTTGRKLAPMSLCLPQIPLNLSLAQTRVAAVESRRPTSCGLAVRVPGYRSRGLGSIPDATKFSEK
jgi:hypothetical protein